MRMVIKILFFLAISAAGFSEKLVNMENGSVVVEFANGKVQFADWFLEIEMKKKGIYIPSSMKQDFDGKEIVYVGDPIFERAFIDVYYPLCIANSLYQWQD
jgi:hypothetical protein